MVCEYNWRWSGRKWSWPVFKVFSLDFPGRTKANYENVRIGGGRPQFEPECKEH
jgi:hypothetical protein